MSLLKTISFGEQQPPSYDAVVAAWKNRDSDKHVFSGHFLFRLASELNRIEGIRIDYNRTREIFESETVSNYTGDVRDLYSVMNNRTVAEYLEEAFREQKPLTPAMILQTHRLMMFGSLDNERYKEKGERAGQYKKHSYCVGRYDVGAKPEDVPALMEELCTLCADTTHDPLKLAAAFHCFFQNIHPFADGNGRVGRWLLNYLLVLRGHPPLIIAAEDKAEYFQCLEKFDRDEDFYTMYSFLRECVVKTYSAWSKE